MDLLKMQRYWLLISFFVGYIVIPSADFVTDIITASNYIGSSSSSYWDPNTSITFYFPQDAAAFDELDSLPSTFLINFTELNVIVDTIEPSSHTNISSAKFRYTGYPQGGYVPKRFSTMNTKSAILGLK